MPGQADPPLSGSLAQRDQDRLAAILSRLASPFDNERAIAGLLASMFIAQRGLNWPDLTRLLLPIRRTPASQTGPESKQDRRHGGCRAWRVPAGETLDLLA
jgi:hypothetical protein